MPKKKRLFSGNFLLVLVLFAPWNIASGQITHSAPAGCAHFSSLAEVYHDGPQVELIRYFDDRDSLLREEALNYTHVLTYNQAGLLKSSLVTDIEGKTKAWHYEYEGGKIKKVVIKFTESPMFIGVYNYNKQGDVEEVKAIDEEGKNVETQSFQYRYDKKGRCLERIHILSNHEKQTRDTFEIQSRKFNKAGQIVALKVSGEFADSDHSYQYDNRGTLEISVETSSFDQTTYFYDSKGRVLKKEVAMRAYDGEERYDLHTIMTYQYDRSGRVIRREWRYANGERFELKEWKYSKCAG